MKTLKTLALTTVAATLTFVAAGAALADGGRMGWGGKDRHGPGMILTQFDLNKDGVLTQDEVTEAVAARFAAADTDKDGKVSLEEFRAFRLAEAEPMRVRAFQRLDSNGDGKVAREEFDRISARMFSRLDRDNDGTLAMMPMGPRGEGKGQGQGMGKGQAHGRGQSEGERGSHGFGPGHGGMMMMGLFERFDSDNDGKITREEFDKVRGDLFAKADPASTGGFDLTGFGAIFAEMGEPRLVRMFQQLDANGDLAITAEENAARTADMIQRLDANNDGVVTKADFRKMKKDGRHGKDGRHDGKRHADAGGKGEGRHGKGPQHMQPGAAAPTAN
ncbi:EF-hand domain-containing protein [Pannonibacter carbonis]|uniref:EF-hand domain-containing protein n=1 Tax=Pannonibacter carbonis TaxID=2067569 RepID=UPI000D0E86E2|nr:EF-hand domain-containing protein [Pannonibacter carbonis]